MAQSRSMKLLNTTEAAESLGVSVRRVRQLITEGRLSAHRVGRDYAIEETALGLVKVYGRAGRPPKEEVNGQDSDKPMKARKAKQH